MISVPTKLGPFLVDEAGRLSFLAEGSKPSFTFLWRNRCFRVQLLGGRLAFSVPAGRVPSSAGGQGKREAALAVLRELPRALPKPWSLRLLPDHRLQLSIEQEMPWPATAAALITPVISLLLRCAPMLDLLDESGLGLIEKGA